MITHHPTAELLVDYAGGATPEPLALLLASHLSICPRCHAAADELEAVGGALLDDLAPAALAEDALARTLARLDAPEAARPLPPEPDSETRALLPRPLWPYVGTGLSTLDWRWRGPALREAVLATPVPGWRASLLRLAPGGSVPVHTHRGTEYTLMLAGGLTNRRTGDHIERGDLEIADGACEHEQVADAAGECLCLAVLDAPVRLSGPLGWVVNPLLKV